MPLSIQIDLASQSLSLYDGASQLLRRYPISSAKLGAGEESGSFRTPRGRHIIRAKIGAGQPLNAVFVARRPTGEIWTPALHAQLPERDWILTRILWLSGTQAKFNRFGRVDSQRRFIYLHGSHGEAVFGQPGSHGCVRMQPDDLLELFDLVETGCEVFILEDAAAPVSAEELVIRALPDHLARAAYQVREAVFQGELGVPPQFERDSRDADAIHLVAWDRWGRAVACARLLPDGSLGRVAVVPDWRGRGAGSRLVAAALAEARRLGWTDVRLAAEANAVGFWRKSGFVTEGETFVEAGIVHQRMVSRLVSPD
ncbi:GNAT family N-acetyltransferase [Chitinimonas arctica]|uniref:GNAT family N-acetyltransferase n=1 Tax=Chitinimonas arctica TaxID=2594795 RepID=A0A516SLQ4_9NEIS|nr:GNAT family N-acetyltransferase [Chitinimonas arctica]QDQ29094.1 GNAT family N-acetyltransferase [Chitinimonas arctica]